MRLTFLQEAREETIVLSSRFMAIGKHLEDQGSLDKNLAEIKEQYPGATHYCYAFCHGAFEKCSDDGEPSRSAGIPLLSLMKVNHLDETLVVVVRYFGGTKLGLGRLRRTYLSSAEKLLKDDNLAEIIEGKEDSILLSYAEADRFIKEATHAGAFTKVLSYSNEVSLICQSDVKIMERLEKMLPATAIVKERPSEILRRKNNDSSQ